jgi:hypothetical protein
MLSHINFVNYKLHYVKTLLHIKKRYVKTLLLINFVIINFEIIKFVPEPLLPLTIFNR